MSGRGRGRGRGGRGPATSQARLLLQKSAAEAGVDERSVINLTRPALYPDMLWHSSGRLLTPDEETAIRISEADKKTLDAKALQFTKRTNVMTFLVRKQRHVLEHFQSSAQFIQHVPAHMDIARYHDTGNGRRDADRPDRGVREALGKLASTDYLPEELLGTMESSDRKGRKRRRNADGTLVDLTEFEAKERGGVGDNQGNSDDESEEEDDDGLLIDPVEEEEEEDDNRDYTQDYYASEDESEGGGGEPTF